jgi:hypothetical protein
MDRNGNLFSYDECIKEFGEFTAATNYYSDFNLKAIQGSFPDVATIKPV